LVAVDEKRIYRSYGETIVYIPYRASVYNGEGDLEVSRRAC
jgi:hypothetical protein